VFSQFTSTLQWLKEELPKHGFQFRTLSGDMPMKKRAKALSDFQNDPPTTIFLLSMRAGAVGINLTQANRIFLMEPCFNPALEAQAVGRVHRLGQKRNVEIIRLLMKDSVESRMVEMLEKKYGKADCSQEDGETDSDTVADDDNNDDDDDADDNDDDDDDTTDGNKKPVAIDAAGTADGDKKPAAIDDGKKPAAAQQVMIGSLYTDKATVVAEEFDLLYGVEPTDTVMEEVSDGGDDLVLEADEGADAVNDDENDDAMWI
jgi:superfamily II DNA or RNA helicase